MQNAHSGTREMRCSRCHAALLIKEEDFIAVCQHCGMRLDLPRPTKPILVAQRQKFQRTDPRSWSSRTMIIYVVACGLFFGGALVYSQCQQKDSEAYNRRRDAQRNVLPSNMSKDPGEIRTK